MIFTDGIIRKCRPLFYFIVICGIYIMMILKGDYNK